MGDLEHKTSMLRCRLGLVVLASLLGVAVIEGSATCRTDMHTFISHSYSCSKVREERKAFYGCEIETPEFVSDLSKAMNVHWNTPSAQFKFQGYEDFYCDNPSTEFPIHDFCSRAMIAQLSYMYNGVHRLASTCSALKVSVALSGRDPEPSSWFENTKPRDKIFSFKRHNCACWEMTYDYVSLYRDVYSVCKGKVGEEGHTCCENVYDAEMKTVEMKRWEEIVSSERFKLWRAKALNNRGEPQDTDEIFWGPSPALVAAVAELNLIAPGPYPSANFGPAPVLIAIPALISDVTVDPMDPMNDLDSTTLTNLAAKLEENALN
eukprot:c18043_g1_i1.p1 GENE.c18043_g1_i1~~c18043_g1_i1.p1  ORF type:complete len:321 (-),score=51.43 c18043_g1_i1:112-1074(-)